MSSRPRRSDGPPYFGAPAYPSGGAQTNPGFAYPQGLQDAPMAPSRPTAYPSAVNHDVMDPTSPVFDPSARTPTRSSANFLAGTMSRNAQRLAIQAAQARARSMMPYPGSMQAAAIGGPAPAYPSAVGGNGDYVGETATPAYPAASQVPMPQASPIPLPAGAQLQPTAPTLPPMPPGLHVNPYAGFQNPAQPVTSRVLPPGAEIGQTVAVDKNALAGYQQSGLSSQDYLDRRKAMDAGPGRIHATLAPDMAENLAQASQNRGGDTKIRQQGGVDVADRYVKPGSTQPSQYAQTLEAARQGAKADYLESQAVGLNSRAGNPDPAVRTAGLNVANAQAEGLAANVGSAREDARENASLREQNRLFMEQGARGGVAENDPRRKAALVNSLANAIRAARTTEARNTLTEQLLKAAEGLGETGGGSGSGGGSGGGGGNPPPPTGDGNLPKVNSLEEAKKLPSGTRFVDPSGVVRQVP